MTTTTPKLTPEVPGRVELPAWLDPAGLAFPESLETIRAEAARLEVEFLDVAGQVIDLLNSFAVVVNATYRAARPYSGDNNSPELPNAVVDAVMAATGAHRLEDLEGWLTGMTGDGASPVSNREAVMERLGWLVEWDQDASSAADVLAKGRKTPAAD